MDPRGDANSSDERTQYFKVSKKFDIPLFCGVWAPQDHPAAAVGASRRSERGKQGKGRLEEEEEEEEEAKREGTVILAGGGGEGRHGVKSRMFAAKYSFDDEELSNDAYHISTGQDAAFRLSFHPSENVMIAAFSKTCQLFEWHPDEEQKIVQSEKSLGQMGEEAGGEQKFVLFSPDGTKVASGRQNGSLLISEWPSLRVLLDVKKSHTAALKDADFSHDASLLATTADSGPCRVWSIEDQNCVASLSIPGKGRLGLCRFSRNETPLLFVTAVMGQSGYVTVWDTTKWTMLGVRKISREPIAAFAICPNNAFLAAGSAGGDVFIIELKSMNTIKTLKAAHMVFVTSLDFSHDSLHLLSVSGDSSARVTPTMVKTNWKEWQILVLLVLGFILTALLAYAWSESELSQRFFQFPLGRQQVASLIHDRWVELGLYDYYKSSNANEEL